MAHLLNRIEQYNQNALNLCDAMIDSASIAGDQTGLSLARLLKNALNRRDEFAIARLRPLILEHLRTLESQMEVSEEAVEV